MMEQALSLARSGAHAELMAHLAQHPPMDPGHLLALAASAGSTDLRDALLKDLAPSDGITLGHIASVADDPALVARAHSEGADLSRPLAGKGALQG